MKKNIAMRVAAFLFILTMISTCAFATTFAKYTTSKETTDTARVAKWGVVLTAENSGEFFAKEYRTTVKVGTTDVMQLVAPGTENVNPIIYTVTGQPEVAVNVNIEATLTLTGWEADGGEYCPLIITVNSEEYYVGKDGITNIAALIAAVEGAIEAKKDPFVEPNVDLSDSITVSWKWEFEKNKVPGQIDLKDSLLGDAAANPLKTTPTIKLDIEYDITQIDN